MAWGIPRGPGNLSGPRPLDRLGLGHRPRQEVESKTWARGPPPTLGAQPSRLGRETQLRLNSAKSRPHERGRSDPAEELGLDPALQNFPGNAGSRGALSRPLFYISGEARAPRRKRNPILGRNETNPSRGGEPGGKFDPVVRVVT